MSRYLNTSLSQVLFSAASHVRAAYKPRANGSSEGNGIWTNDDSERLSDHRPVSFVGQITEEVTDAAAVPPLHITPAVRIMSMFERHVLNPEHKEMMENSAAKESATPIVRRHHVLVLWSHWLNVPILLGLILSGMSIYWASPVYQHKPDPTTGNVDFVPDVGTWICAHVPGLQHYSSPPDWVYNHMSLGPYLLADALRLHWFFAYLFMLNGLVYIAGLGLSGEWRALLPRLTDLRDALKMTRYYTGKPVAILLRRTWLHPRFTTKYNALQRLAYFSIPVAACLSVATGWSIHKPMQLHWLAAIFGGYDAARMWHFWLMWLFILFAVPHVILVFADGRDTLRSIIVGWSARGPRSEEFENER